MKACTNMRTFTSVHRSIIHNRQNLQTTQMLNSGWMDKQMLVYSSTEILLSNAEEWTTATNSRNDLRNIFLTKEDRYTKYIVWESTNVEIKKRQQSTVTKKMAVISWGLGNYEVLRYLFGLMGLFLVLTVVIYHMDMCICQTSCKYILSNVCVLLYMSWKSKAGDAFCTFSRFHSGRIL